MAFLDNSGDIILDAVLTDAGRKRMAEGNFRIAKYAFGDDEINYAQYNKNDPRGSAFYDLEIMQTPVLEAFTNNSASMSSFLMTLANNNHTHLPILKLNENWGKVGGAKSLKQHLMVPVGNSTTSHTSMSRDTFLANAPGANTTVSSAYVDKLHSGTFIVTCNAATEEIFKFKNGDNGVGTFGANADYPQKGSLIPQGIILGSSTNSATQQNKNYICIDQGIVGQAGQQYGALGNGLAEDVFMVEADTRFCEIITAPRFTQRNIQLDQVTGYQQQPVVPGAAAQPFSFVDDDFIGTALLEGASFISPIVSSYSGDRNNLDNPNAVDSLHVLLESATQENGHHVNNNWAAGQVFTDSPVGNRLQFSIRASRALQDSDDLFIRLGSRTKVLSRYLPAPDSTVDNGFAANVKELITIGGGTAEEIGGTATAGYTSGVDLTTADAEPAGQADNTVKQAGRAIPVYYIDTMIRVTGYNFGQSIDIPVRFVRKVEA